MPDAVRPRSQPVPGEVRVPVVLRLPAEPGALIIARRVATGMASATGMSEEATADVKVAVTEACTNVVRHAYPDKAPGAMTISAWTGAGRLMIAVHDDGVGFSGDGRRTSGVGLIAIAALAAEVGVRSYDGRGTEIVMAFPTP